MAIFVGKVMKKQYYVSFHFDEVYYKHKFLNWEIFHQSYDNFDCKEGEIVKINDEELVVEKIIRDEEIEAVTYCVDKVIKIVEDEKEEAILKKVQKELNIDRKSRESSIAKKDKMINDLKAEIDKLKSKKRYQFWK